MPKPRQYYTIKVPKGKILSIKDKNGRLMMKPVTMSDDTETEYDLFCGYFLSSEIAQADKDLASKKNKDLAEKSVGKHPADFIKENNLKVNADTVLGV